MCDCDVGWSVGIPSVRWPLPPERSELSEIADRTLFTIDCMFKDFTRLAITGKQQAQTPRPDSIILQYKPAVQRSGSWG